MPRRKRLIVQSADGQIANDVMGMVIRVVEALNSVSPVPSNCSLKVLVAPAMAIETPDGVTGFGVFGWGRCDRNAEIYIGGRFSSRQMPDDFTRREWLRFTLPCILAHEWAHFEQWRDGKELTERGIEVRMRSLLRLIGREIPKAKEEGKREPLKVDKARRWANLPVR